VELYLHSTSMPSWGGAPLKKQHKYYLVLLLLFSTGFYSPYRTLAFLNGLLDPQIFGRTPWLGDQSNTIIIIIIIIIIYNNNNYNIT
jgi:hypothetical protein